MDESKSYDVVVIGSGIGGYVAAIRLAQIQKKVLLIEKNTLGGTCLNSGCIPTSVLLAVSDTIDKIHKAKDFGVKIEKINVDFQKIMARKNKIVTRLIQGVNYLINKNKIDLVYGKARIISKKKVSILTNEGVHKTANAKYMIVATGSEENHLDYKDIDEERIITTKGALSLKECPQNIVITSGDIMGIEFAVIFKALGAEVTILEESPYLLSAFDKEIGKTYRRILQKKGIALKMNCKVKSITAKPNAMVCVEAEDTSDHSKVSLQTEKVLILGARRPCTDDLGLCENNIGIKDGFIVVDEHMKTTVPNIFAIGDVTGGRMFAHAALAEAKVAVENIVGSRTRIDIKMIPMCLFSQPEVASVGLSEEETINQGYNYVVGRFPLSANGKALALGEPGGFVKIISEAETGEILGVHIVSPHATDLIGEIILAMSLECTSDELGDIVHPHPTISESITDAARAVKNRSIQI